MTVPAGCACPVDDRYDCIRERYPRPFDEDEATVEEIDTDGGPCDCACHDVEDDEDYLGDLPL